MSFYKNSIGALTLLALLSSILIAGCGADDTEVLVVGPHQQRCQGFIEQDCFLVYNEADDEWELFYENIGGFDFEPGFVYTLKVRLEDRGEEIQDVGRYAYHLVEVLKKVEADVSSAP